jgi:hypothetical protein
VDGRAQELTMKRSTIFQTSKSETRWQTLLK